MLDVLCYIPNSAGLMPELQEKAPELISESGGFSVTKTPVITNPGGESLILIRCDDALVTVFEELNALIMLGTYDDVFADPDLREIYDRVYDQAPTIYIDENGLEHTVNKPEKFGVFA